MKLKILALVLPTVTAACSITGGVTERLSDAMLNHPDPETVSAAAPAFLLLIDAMIAGDPGDADRLLTGARLYGAYAALLEEAPQRRQILSDRAWQYALAATCEKEEALCAAVGAPFEIFEAAVAQADDAPVVYGLAVAWIGRIQADPGDWTLLADLARAEQLMSRSLALDPAIDSGGGEAYMGVLKTLRPPALGGKPEEGRAHFERALALSGGHNLMYKVLYARHYARGVFDRETHDRLVAEVLAADPEADKLTLINRLAQQEAARLAADAADYF